MSLTYYGSLKKSLLWASFYLCFSSILRCISWCRCWSIEMKKMHIDWHLVNKDRKMAVLVKQIRKITHDTMSLSSHRFQVHLGSCCISEKWKLEYLPGCWFHLLLMKPSEDKSKRELRTDREPWPPWIQTGLRPVGTRLCTVLLVTDSLRTKLLCYV